MTEVRKEPTAKTPHSDDWWAEGAGNVPTHAKPHASQGSHANAYRHTEDAHYRKAAESMPEVLKDAHTSSIHDHHKGNGHDMHGDIATRISRKGPGGR